MKILATLSLFFCLLSSLLGQSFSPSKDSLASDPSIAFAGDRLFISRTAIPMEKGELVYQNILLTGQRVHYGLLKNVSINAGFDVWTWLLERPTNKDGKLEGDEVGITSLGIHAGIPLTKRLFVGADIQLGAFQGWRVMASAISFSWITRKASYTLKLGKTGGMGDGITSDFPWYTEIGFVRQMGGKWSYLIQLAAQLEGGDFPGPTGYSYSNRISQGLLITGARWHKGRHAIDIGLGAYGTVGRYITFREPEGSKISDRIIRDDIIPAPYVGYTFRIR
ncbi:MAG: hypothetical protein AAFY71_02445 [Bacteroidota bacterium]